MTEEDHNIVEYIVNAYQTKGLAPKKLFLGLVIRNDVFCSKPDGETCAIGAVLVGNRATTDCPYQLAADVLNIPVSVVMGIATGFDAGNTFSVGPQDARGMAIGAEVASRLFKKPKKYQT